MKRTLSKSLAWLLTLLMLFTALPVDGLSEALVEPAPMADATPVPTEDEGAVPAPAEDVQTDAGDEPEATPADVAALRLTEESSQIPVQDAAALFAVQPNTEKYLTYQFYKGETLLSEQIVKTGDTLYEPSVPTNAHEEFTGWDKDVSFGTVAGTIEETKTIVVKAKIDTVYYVFFKDESGRVIKTVKAGDGENVKADATFTVGATQKLVGWCTDEALANMVSSVTIAGEDVTLYAKVVDGYWVTFVSNGGSYISPAFYAAGDTASAPSTPTKAGYDFDGWYTDDEALTAADFEAIKANTTVYAKWTESENTKYTVIHWLENADDDGYSFKESETLYGKTNASTNARAKSSNTKDYQGFTARDITQETIAGDGSTIVNVYYKRNVYEVKFYSYSGMFSEPKEYATLRITAKYGAYIGDKWPTYNGSNSWATSDGGNTYQSNIDTMPLGGATFYGPNTGSGSETAYYYVEVLPGESGTAIGGVTYKLHHSDTSPGTGYTVTKEDKYDIAGFTYSWGTEDRQKYNNAKFYYTRNEYKIVFVNKGGEGKTVPKKFEQSIADAAGYTPTAPAGKAGYVFAGWYENELGEGEQYVFDGKTMPAQNITLYAKWVAPVHTVTVYAEDKTTKLGEISDIPHGEQITEAQMPEYTAPEDQEFLGWVLRNGTAFSFDTEIRRDYNLYALTRSTGKFTVTYDPNGGEGTAFTDSDEYAEGALADVKANGFTNGDKVFLGWNTAADGTGETYYPGGSIEIGTANVTLYAIWGDKAQTVELTYHANGGNGNDITESYANNTLVTLKDEDTFTRTGYTLTGWNTQADGTGTAFGLGGSARVDNVESNDLYAVWTPNTNTPYKVEFYYQKDDQSGYELKYTDNRTGTTDTTASVTEADKAPKENGKYVFEADNVNNLLSDTIAADGSLVLKLYFKLNQFSLTIHYVYEDGTEANPDYTATLTVGDNYSVESPEINGYTASETTVSGTMPANNVVKIVTYTKRSDLSYTVNYYWNDTTEPVKPSKTVNGQTFNAVITDEQPVTAEGYTALPNQTSNLIISTDAEKNVINFYYYKNVELTANSDSKVYDGTEQSVSGFTGAPEGADFSDITVSAKGTDVGEYPANFAEGTVGTIDATEKYIVKAANNGKLTITPVTDEVIVKIEGNKATYEYDATEKIVTGYKVVSISNDLYKEENFSMAENAKAEARGTDAGSYLMGLTALSFVNNSKNFVNVKFVVEDGKLTITRRGAGDMKVTVTANDNKGIIYDGKAHGENGYTTANLVEGHSVKSVVIDGSRIDAGLYEDELVPHDAIIVDEQGNDVTKNYLLTYIAGDLEILKRGIPDDPKNPNDPKLVKIIANDSKAEYDGQAHGENGYTSTNLVEGQSVKSALVSGSKTDAGLYENELVPSGAIIVDAQGNDVTKNYFLTYVAGDLEITKRAATVTANDNKGILYDGKEHGGNGYTSSNLLDGHTVTGVVIDGAKVDAGLYEDALVPHDATIVDAQGNDVSANYELTYIAGDLEITPIMDEIIVKITGHKGYFIYDGTRKTLIGYDVEVSDPSYALDNIVFTGSARVHGVEPGVYMMGLKEDQFHDKGNYANVKFIVIDGVMTIVRGKHYVAWLHDTSMMIDSAEKSDTLTAISSYLERTKIQTVFHSGNVVADPTSQEQWDAFNDTMKHLYDNERRTFIVNGAAQDAVENSLFLDQPFREEYLENDMFEEGKGIVDRFEMGGIKMIMVTLSDDALTEEGLKWARDKFNAESDRVGILMVNTYLTEDKKIAESAEEIEKQIVSVCSNVRLVLSSNAEYNSHESFKYGERTVWALNADIEAATAEGYITLLEFDADTRSLYVTTYSPVKNDFVYDDDKLEYEQFTLYNAF